MSDYDPFAASYDALASTMTEDIAFYVSLAAEASGPVVELAVGNGRVAVPVALETGRRVVGIDLSPAMLDGARERAREAGVELDLRLGDMRSFDLDEPTDLVICPFRAMLHLSSQGERVEVLRRVRDSLVPGGRFAWNVFVFDPEVAREYDGQWREEAGVRSRADYDYRRATDRPLARIGRFGVALVG